MAEVIIKAQHLSYRYTSARDGQQILANVSMEIKRGSCVAIIGFNGSGKSTLVQHFNGLLQPTEGTLWVDGVVVNKNEDLRALRQRVGMLFQFPEQQLFGQTIFADVAFGLRRMHLSRREVRTRVIEALDTVGLPHQQYALRSPFELSGGQRRRVALAGILAMKPTILILDEPSVGLDAHTRHEFYAYLRHIQHAQGVTIVLVSHDMTEVSSIADELFILHQGTLVLQGSPHEIFAQGDLLQQWHLAVPPLHAFVQLLRQQGLVFPEDACTYAEVLAALKQQWEQLPDVAPGS